MDKDQCSICLDTIKNHDLEILQCYHKYHKSCINDWIRSNIIIINNDTKKWARFVSAGFRHRRDILLSVYDSGEFSCPVCHDNFTLMHPLDLDLNLLSDNDNPIYRRYEIKIKYAQEGISIKELWFCHYLENYNDFLTYFTVPHPDDFVCNHDDKINIIVKNLCQIKQLSEDLNKKHETLVLHAIDCNCNNENCIGFFFVPESKCPLCVLNLKDTIVVPDHFEHASVNKIGKYIDKWFLYVKKYIHDIVSISYENHSHVSSDDNSNEEISDDDKSNDLIDPDNSSNNSSNLNDIKNDELDNKYQYAKKTTRGRVRGRGRGNGRYIRGRSRGRYIPRNNYNTNN
jgi:hypothetical protein